MKLPYGYYLDEEGGIAIHEEKANTVRMLYRQYLSGMSLGGIADLLYERRTSSPKGKERWTQPVISSMLSNSKYIDAIVSFDEFFAVQMEKGKRSLNDEDTGKRKATRYSSQSVLSGLLICGECGCNYRRITRPSGEIVWRCANRVEHGKQYCQESPTIPEQKVKDDLCDALKLAEYDEAIIKDHIEQVIVSRDGALEIEIRQQTLSQILGW